VVPRSTRGQIQARDDKSVNQTEWLRERERKAEDSWNYELSDLLKHEKEIAKV
jgi:hypothetical protein